METNGDGRLPADPGRVPPADGRTVFLGADGGGTGTALCALEGGRRIASGRAGPLNYRFIPAEEAVRNLAEGVAALGVAPERIAAIGVADPALDDAAEADDAEAARFRALLEATLPFPVFVRSDVRMALFGLTDGTGPGVLVVAGTGAMGIAEDAQGRVLVAGGWGRLAGDGGSGYFIATEGIRAALGAFEGVSPPTALTGALPAFFGVPTLRALIPVFYGTPAPDVASFATEVARCAEAGDAESLRILDEAARHLVAYADRLVRFSGARTVGIYGGVLLGNRRVRGRFEAALRERFGDVAVAPPPVPPEEAAALYAERNFKEGTKHP